MGRSIIVDVRKGIVEGLSAALQADLVNAGVSCTYGWLGGSDDARREEIYTNRPRATHEPASLKAGRNFRNEVMDFDVVVRVVDPTKRPEDVDDRLMDLVQVVEEFVADHKSNELGIAGLMWLIATNLEIENRLGATGSGSLAQITLRYSARLT